MFNCRNCSNLITINEYGDFERRCAKGLETKNEGHDCKKYVRLIMCCSDCS
jgi:hypothetical protein